MTVSIPPPLEAEVKKLAKRHHQTTSELVRAALRVYLDRAAWETAWKRTRVYATRQAKKHGIRSAAQLQGILDELRHGSSPVDATTAARRR